MSICWTPIMRQRLLGSGKTVETNINPRTIQMNGEMVSVTRPIKGGPQRCESLQCWTWPRQGDGDGFPEQVVLEPELCRMHTSLQGKGRWKELSSYRISTTRPCYNCIYHLCSDSSRATKITWPLQSWTIYQLVSLVPLGRDSFLLFFFFFLTK